MFLINSCSLYTIIFPKCHDLFGCHGNEKENYLKIFSSETIWPIEVKFHVEALWDGATKVCSQCQDHMTKMAATPI